MIWLVLLPCYTHIWFSICVFMYIHLYLGCVCFCAPLLYATNSFPLRYIHTQIVVVVKVHTLLLLLPPCQRMMKMTCECVCVFVCAKQNLKINNMPNSVCGCVCTRQCISNSTAIRNPLSQAHLHSLLLSYVMPLHAPTMGAP